MGYTISTYQPGVTGAEIAGQRVSIATLPNTRPNNYPYMDCGTAVSLEGVTEALPKVLDSAFEAAKNAVAGIQGTTGTMVLFDPTTMQLWLRSHGDSPAYVVLHDDSQGTSAAIRITHPGDSLPDSLMLSSLSQPLFDPHGVTYDLNLDEEPPPKPPSKLKKYQLARIEHYEDYMETLRDKYQKETPNLKLNEFIEETATWLGMNPSHTHATLVVGSDGISNGFGLSNIAYDTDFTDMVGRRMRDRHWKEAALDIAEESARRYDDDMTIIMLPLEKGVGHPVGVMVADGHGKLGAESARTAIDAFQTALDKATGRDQVPEGSTIIEEANPGKGQGKVL